MNAKWITDGHFWIEFGRLGDLVDIANSQGDVLTQIPKPLADKIILAHNDAIQAIEDRVEKWQDEIDP